MASLSEILPRRWPGAEWSLSADDYATLNWLSATPKPGEAEIRAFSAEVDAEIQAEADLERKRTLLDRADSLLQALEILSDAVADLQTRAGVTGPVRTRVNALASKLSQIRAS
jgi:hypothetical protein